MKPSKKLNPPKTAARSCSIKHAIGITGFPKDAFDWALENGCPHIDDHGRVTIAPFREWMKEHWKQTPVEGELVTKKQAEIMRLLKQCRDMDFNFDVKAGRYLLKADVESWLVNKIEFIKSVLNQKLCNELPPHLEGLRAPEISLKMKTAMTPIVEALRMK